MQRKKGLRNRNLIGKFLDDVRILSQVQRYYGTD